MQLKSLRIRQNWNATDNYVGEAEFAGDAGTITINLTDELSRRVLAVCADEVVKAGKRAAENMTAEVISTMLEYGG